MQLWDLFDAARRRAPGAPALQLADGTTRTCDALFAAAEDTAGELAARGLRRGDRLALWLGNREETVLAYLAALRLGAVVLPLNLAYRRQELAHVFADATPRLLLAEAEQLAVLDEVGRDAIGDAGVLPVEELRDAAARTAGELPLPRPGDDELAMLLYTSGTTGRSKGARITHNNLLATVTGLLAAWAWEPRDRLLLSLPLFHTHGLVVGLLTALAAGAAVRLRRRFDAEATLAELAAGEATLFFGVPTMYVRLVELLERRGAPLPLPAVRLCCSGSAPLAPETFAAFRAATGHAILERYGMTETGMLLSNPYVGERVPGTVGTPLPGVSARVVPRDAEGDTAPAPLPDGEAGELLVRGSNVFAGYWRDPEKTAASFAVDADGRRWFRTGDLARRDPATGYYTLLGRSRELILRGGFNVYPREIEEALLGVGGVREAAVVGRRDREWGEVPVAFVVADAGVEEAALRAHCERELARFKHPAGYRFVDALPRNALGKVQKHLLGD